MPSLSQMYALVDSKSYFTRTDDEIYAALQEGGFLVYSAILKEFRGMFLKVDSSSVTLTPGTQEYSLPADVSELLAIAERESTSENWHEMDPEDLQDVINNVQQNLSYFDYGLNYGEKSQFRFYGPYTDATDAENSPASAQIPKIRVSPNPTENRYVQIAYAAKWLPITSSASKVMLPDEGTYAMQNYAIAEALRANDDTLADRYEAKGDKALTAFLVWLRATQSTKSLSVTPYLE